MGKGSKLGEFQVLRKLYPTSVPVPKVYDVGEDILGSEFIIMEKMQGQNMLRLMDGIIEGRQAQMCRQYSTMNSHLEHPNIHAEWYNTAIRTCIGVIEKKTGANTALPCCMPITGYTFPASRGRLLS